jgi:hypothetical protein
LRNASTSEAVGRRARSGELRGSRNGYTADKAAWPRNLTALRLRPSRANQRMTALSTVLDEKLLAFLLEVNSPMALAEQHIETLSGNAQHYERELFVRTLTISARCATGAHYAI